MTSIYHYSITQSIFQCPKNPIYPFPHPQPLATTVLFTVPIVLPFLECHLVGITQYITFSDGLLSFSIEFIVPPYLFMI